jgi:hypothetical protein
LIKTAQYLGVAPWDLEQAPAKWLLRAQMMEAAEARAEETRAAHARSRG